MGDEVMKFKGSNWWKFDFHTHTPASLDYKGNKEITPREWLDDYRNQGIKCVIVSDHNSGGWIDNLKNTLSLLKQQNPSVWEDMTIFPGIELSCSGGVHLLAILDPSKGSSDIDAIRGSCGYTGTPGDSDSVTRQSVEEVIKTIQSLGGIACAAHIDQPKGLLSSITDHNTLQPIFNLLDAVEVIDPSHSLIQKYVENLSNLAFLLGSDSHNPSEIGRGYTWVKMSEPSIEGLKLALLDPNSAIRRSDEYPDCPQKLNHSRIKSITIEKLRLRQVTPLRMDFNPSYNALIGGRGSGKSSILECLRLGLARDNELLGENADSSLKQYIENFKKEKTSRNLPGMMLNDTKIIVEVSKGAGDLEEKFEYSWKKGVNGKFSVSVKRWEQDHWQETELTEEQARNNFPVNIFSQKQILSLADNPQHLIQYIDDVLGDNKKNWEKDFEEKRACLYKAREHVRVLEKQIAEKPVVEIQYKEASRKARVFLASNFSESLNVYQRAKKQKQEINSFFGQLNDYIQLIKHGIKDAYLLKNISLSNFEMVTENEKQMMQTANKLTQKISDDFKQIENLVNSMEQTLLSSKESNKSSSWYIENQKNIDEYARIVEDFKSQGILNAEEAT